MSSPMVKLPALLKLFVLCILPQAAHGGPTYAKRTKEAFILEGNSWKCLQSLIERVYQNNTVVFIIEAAVGS